MVWQGMASQLSEHAAAEGHSGLVKGAEVGNGDQANAMRPRVVSPIAFRAWQGRHGLANGAAARLLAVSINSIPKYRKDGADHGIGLAMLACDAGLSRYDPDTVTKALRLSALSRALDDMA